MLCDVDIRDFRVLLKLVQLYKIYFQGICRRQFELKSSSSGE